MYYQRRRDGNRGKSAVPAGGWEAAVYSVDTDDFVSMCITSIDKTGGLFVFLIYLVLTLKLRPLPGWSSRL